MIYCRYCGVPIAEDSQFCSKCGKRLGRALHPRLDKIVTTLALKTPYPYFLALVLAFATWTLWPGPPAIDYSNLKWTFELDNELNRPEDHSYLQALSLVVENVGDSVIRDIPIDLLASIEPRKPADVTAGFLGRHLLILQQGQPLPLTLVLSDPLDPGAKRRYLLEGAVNAAPPFRITYEVREEHRPTILASYSFQQ